ncbi:hypothetical protein FRX31_005928 [Thalictrum thalictroides]|uniref:Uncharacterized protein n=1 Tax=Thalictrum thalictroides TaxID=46969 RepID=A0A7J6X534_THATH|nr:hypothetical protein FRX31_005928 [Thalictrum thalictroides]
MTGCPSLGSMDNLYKSKENLCDEDPENFKRYQKPFNPKTNGGFLKGPEIFMATDELLVVPFSSVSSVSFITKLGVPLSDLEERIATVGEQEVRSIFLASWTTSTALTNVFCKKN